MMWKYWQYILRAPDDPPAGGGEGSPLTPPSAQPPAAQPPDGKGEDAKSYTQAELDRMQGDARRQARGKAIGDFVAGLGFKDEAETKAFFEQMRDKAEGEKSDLEKLKARHDRLEAEAKELREYKKRSLAEKTILLAADKAKLKWFSEQARQDAIAVLLAGSEVGDDGAIAGIEDAIKALQKERAYLFETATPPPPDIDATKRGGGATVLDDEAKKALADKFGVQAQYIK